MKESYIESYLVRKVKEHGGLCYKFVSPGNPGVPDRLIIDVYKRQAWYKDLEEYATKALLDGKPIEGWKLVAGRSIRTFTDQDAAIQAAIAAGYDEALLYDRKPKTLSEMEKLMGKAEFAEKIGGYVTKPLGCLLYTSRCV